MEWKKLTHQEVAGALINQHFAKINIDKAELFYDKYTPSCEIYFRNLSDILIEILFLEPGKGLMCSLIRWNEKNLEKFIREFEKHLKKRWKQIRKPEPLSRRVIESSENDNFENSFWGEYAVSLKAKGLQPNALSGVRVFDEPFMDFMNDHFLFLTALYVAPLVLASETGIEVPAGLDSSHIQAITLGNPILCLPGLKNAGKKLSALLFKLQKIAIQALGDPPREQRGRPKSSKTLILRQMIQMKYSEEQQRNKLRGKPLSSKEIIFMIHNDLNKSPHTVKSYLHRKQK